MGAVPLIYNTGTGHLLRRLNTDCDLPGNILTLDSDNTGTAADCSIVAEQGTGLNGTITFSASNNRWEIAGTDAVTDALYITKAPSTSKAGSALNLVMGANSTGDAISASILGTGHGLTVTLGNTAAQVLVATESVNGTQPMVSLTRSGTASGKAVDIVLGATTTGAGIEISAAGSGQALWFRKSGAGVYGMQAMMSTGTTLAGICIVPEAGSSGEGLLVTPAGTGGGVNVYSYSSSSYGYSYGESAASSGTALTITRSSTSSGIGVGISMGASTSGMGIRVDGAGSGYGVAVYKTGASGVGFYASMSAATGGIAIQVVQSGTGHVFYASKTGTGNGFELVMGAATTGAGFYISNSGSGNTFEGTATTGVGMNLAISGTGDGIDVVKSNTGAGYGLYVSMGASTTSHGAHLAQSGSGNAINLVQSGAGDALAVALSHASAQALVVTESTAGANSMVSLTRSVTGATGDVITITKSPAATTAGDAVFITMGANTSGQALRITQAGSQAGLGILKTGATGNALNLTNDTTSTGDAISLAQTGSGNAISIAISTSTTTHALTVSETAAGTAAMIYLARNTTGATGDVISITKAPGSSTGGNGIYVSMGANASSAAHAISLVVAGPGAGVYVSKTTTGAGEGVSISMGANTTGIGVNVTGSGSGDCFRATVGAAAEVGLNLVVANASAKAITIADFAVAPSSDAVTITRLAGGTGRLLYLQKSASGTASGTIMEIASGTNATGAALYVNVTGAATHGIYVLTSAAMSGTASLYVECTGATDGLRVTKNAASGLAGSAIYISHGANQTATALVVDNLASASAPASIGVFGDASAITQILRNGRLTLTCSNTGQAMTVTNTYSSTYTGNVVELRSSNASGTGWTYLRCYAAGSGTSLMKIRGDGWVYATGSSTPGSDYAEYVNVLDCCAVEPGDVLEISGADLFAKSSTGHSTKIAGVYSTAPAVIGNDSGCSFDLTSGTVETAAWTLWAEERDGASYQRIVFVGDVSARYTPGLLFTVGTGTALDVVSVEYRADSDDTLVVFGSDTISVKLTSLNSSLRYGLAALNRVPMAMLGRVPTKCITSNGSISYGDLLTTSEVPGRAMKADGNTPRGAILGKALGSLTDDGSNAVTGLVSVYVNLQ